MILESNCNCNRLHWHVIDPRSGVADGKHLAKVSKRSTTERKRAKIENLNAYLHINMNSHI